MDSISIIIPAFKEQEKIRESVTEAISAAEIERSDYEIIIINDGSNLRFW